MPKRKLGLSRACAFALLGSTAIASFGPATGNPSHHMKRKAPLRARGSSGLPLVVTNQCTDTVWPGIVTQSGTGPDNTGFELQTGENQTLSVSTDWQGRVWGRTNCSFSNSGSALQGGKACDTGDCGGLLACKATGETPVSLAEFTLDGGDGQTYYDISLVDGYNMPMAITMLANGNSSFEDIPPNLTNPSCVGSVGDLAAQNWDPYSSGSFLGTNSSYELPFEDELTSSEVAQWCPWDLQVNPPMSPGDGVYPYPDGNIQRPAFNPCFSACAKYNKPAYCCTGSYDGSGKCDTNYYSKKAKSVCPDAYSFAYDDIDSTFVIPAGAGFQVIFCPGGRSTNILQNKADQESQLKNQGHVSGGSNSTATSGAQSLTVHMARSHFRWLLWTIGVLSIL